MNNFQKTVKGITNYQLLVMVFRTKDQWFSSLSLSLLTTILGIGGILPAAKADELPKLLQNPSNKESPTFLDGEMGTWGESESGFSNVLVSEQHQESSHSAIITDVNETEESVDSAIANSPKEAELSTQSAVVLETQSPLDTVPNVEAATEPQPLLSNPIPDTTEPLSETPVESVVQNASPTTLAPNEVRILSPQSGSSTTGSTNLVVQYNADSQIQVNVNKNPIDPAIITQTERDEVQNIVTQVWYNIPLEEGENTLTVQAGDGTPSSIELTVAEKTVQIEIAPVGDPRVPADGRSTINLQGRVTDENGQPIAEDTVVTLTASSGKFVGADEDKDQLGFQVVARDGLFSAQLQSSLEAQKVRIRAAVEELEQEDVEESPQLLIPSSSSLEAYTQIEFVTNLRPSLVSGVVTFRIGASGTDFWGSRRDFLNPDLIDEGTDIDLDGAVFATG